MAREIKLSIKCEMCNASYLVKQSYVRSFYGPGEFKLSYSYYYPVPCPADKDAWSDKYTKLAAEKTKREKEVRAWIKSRLDRGLPIHVKCDCDECRSWRLANLDKIKDLQW